MDQLGRGAHQASVRAGNRDVHVLTCDLNDLLERRGQERSVVLELDLNDEDDSRGLRSVAGSDHAAVLGTFDLSSA